MKLIKKRHNKGKYVWPAILLGLALFGLSSTGFSLPVSSQGPPIDGPLRKLGSNPRYFTNNSGKAVYLTGSHTWDAFQRWFANNERGGFTAQSPANFTAYLNVLESHNHNFIRFWVADTAYSPATGARIEPQPYLRTTNSSLGKAKDGGLKFDLNKLNDDYFNTIASLVRQARDKRIYVSLMLFDGWGTSEYGVKTKSGLFNTWPYHPFNGQNNINNVHAKTVNGVGVGYHTAAVGSPIWNLQTKYVRRLIKAVNGYDNVLYEICNESGKKSTKWQLNMIDYIKNHESQNYSKVHPVGMTFQFGGTKEMDEKGTNKTLFDSPAEWVSPDYRVPNSAFNYRTDPPPADGSKVIIIDTDHTLPTESNPVWVWKSFMRGLNPIVMDWWTGAEDWEPIRYAMGRTRDIALNHVDLTNMVPVTNNSNTKYCLAEEGKQYIGYLYTKSSSVHSFRLDLPAGTYDAYWVSTVSDNQSDPTQFTTSGEKLFFDAPNSSPNWVLIVKAVDDTPPPPPPSDDPAFLMDDNEVVMEAEHASSRSAATTGQKWANVSESEASGASSYNAIQATSNALASAPGPDSCRADYLIDVPQGSASKFYVHLHARGANGNNDSLFVSIDGDTSTYKRVFVPIGPAVGDWVRSAKLSVPSGQHTLTLWMREDGAIVDKIVLSASGITPSGTGPTESLRQQGPPDSAAFLMEANEVVMEAEHTSSRLAASTGQTWVDIRESGASGDSSANAIQATHNVWANTPGLASCRVDYLIDVPEGSAPRFHVYLRGRGANAIDDSLFVSIDDEVYLKAYLPQGPAVGTWTTPGKFTIPPGQHTLTLWMREDGAIIDKIVVSASSTRPSGMGPDESPQE